MEPRPASRHDPARDDWWWVFDPRISLRARVALLVGVSALAFTLGLNAVTSALLQKSLERQLGGGFEMLAFQMSDKLDRVIQQRAHELQLTAGLGPFRTGAATATERRQLLEAMQDAARDFAWIGFAGVDGQISAATRGLLEGTSADARPWFRTGRERPYAGNLGDAPALTRALSASDETPSARYLDLSVPVNAVSGQFLGVLGAYVHWEWAREVQLSVVPESARRERIGVTVYSANGEVLLDSGGSGWTLPPDAPAISDSRRFRGSLVENTATGTTYLTGYVRSRGYREYRGLGWLVTVRQPLALALAPVAGLKHTIMGWGFAFTGFFVVVSWLLAGRLARRLRRIGAAARRIEEGDVLTVLPRPQGQGELDRMCHALGDMVEGLRRPQPPGTDEQAPGDPSRRS
jgi:HAMP domain-containing protein